jgi:gamma-glutamylcyclotransferase (GGCT)/AIG2-like uncharacterized protein YtfP
MVYYFAYGSNLDWEQMKDRCPSVSFMGKALLDNYELAFTRRSSKRECGVADIIESKGAIVWGVVYTLNEDELKILDEYEGFHPEKKNSAYIRREVIVFVDGDKSNPITSFTYQVQEPSEDHIPPSSDYLDQIISGAEFWKLDRDYIEKLKSILIQ